MKNLQISLTILTILAAGPAFATDHILDRAWQALSQGDTGHAVDLYRQSNTELPTAEGYNNVGVALERSGRFADAAEAYGQSLQLPNPAKETELNLRRARLRGLAQIALPYAACVFAGLVVMFALVWLAKYLVGAWRAWQFQMKFRGVRAISLTHRVQCRDGQLQPDGKVYCDSESISIKADLLLPQRQDVYPLQLDLEVVQPDGTVWRTPRESVASFAAERVTVWFQLDQVGEVLNRSGTWKARLVLRNIDKILAVTTFTVVTRAELIADLEAVDARLIAVQGDRTGPERVIFPDVEAVVPAAVIRPRSCHPSKFTGMRLRLDLMNLDKRDDVESQEFPLELTEGRMEFCSVSRPVAGDEIARKLGRWEFRLIAEGRQLARMPFVITSHEQGLASLKVESFEIAGIPRTGRAAKVGKVAYVRNLRAMCPVMKVTTPFPSPKARYEMTVGVCVDGQPVGGVEGTLVMDRGAVEIILGEYSLPGLPDGREGVRVSFVLMVEGRMLGVREVTLRARPPRCADAQGRIMDAPSAREMNYDDEAARILGEARIAG